MKQLLATLGVLLALIAPCEAATPTHIQGGFTDSSGTSCAVTLGSAVGVGNSVVGYIQFPNAQPISTILDDKGNSYAVVKSVSSGGTFSFAVFSLVNITNGPKTITVNFTGSASQCSQGIDEYSNVAALDVTTPSGGATGQFITTASGTDALTSGSLTTSTNGDLIWGAIAATVVAPSVGTGFTVRNNDSSNGYISEDLIQSSAGATAVTATVSSGGGWAIAVAMRAAGTASPGSHRLLLGVGH